jgi:hypothetical protein
VLASGAVDVAGGDAGPLGRAGPAGPADPDGPGASAFATGADVLGSGAAPALLAGDPLASGAAPALFAVDALGCWSAPALLRAEALESGAVPALPIAGGAVGAASWPARGCVRCSVERRTAAGADAAGATAGSDAAGATAGRPTSPPPSVDGTGRRGAIREIWAIRPAAETSFDWRTRISAPTRLFANPPGVQVCSFGTCRAARGRPRGGSRRTSPLRGSDCAAGCAASVGATAAARRRLRPHPEPSAAARRRELGGSPPAVLFRRRR